MYVFIFLVVLGCILLWILSSFAYVPLGKFAKRIWGDAKDAMNDYKQKEKESNDEKE